VARRSEKERTKPSGIRKGRKRVGWRRKDDEEEGFVQGNEKKNASEIG